MPSLTHVQIEQAVTSALASTPIIDMHTHLYPPAFGTPVPHANGAVDPKGLLLWGADELLTYHYLVAEVFRAVPATKLPYEEFWRMSKQQQADHIWKNLFVERSPISEACRGVLTTMQKLGLDTWSRDLRSIRKFFAEQNPNSYIDKVMELSNVSSITMTNPVFDDNERNRWLADAKKVGGDPRFKAVLRIDPILRDYPNAAKRKSEWGYRANAEIDASTIEESRRFLREWIDRQNAIYLAVSLPPAFRYPAPADNAIARSGQTMLEKVVLPVCEERGLPFAMMIGSNIGVNPALRDGGDMVGRADIESVTNLCREFPRNRFFVTMLARENQHELCVAARKFGNLMVFGCWWFVNNPSLIEEITRMRVELLGTSFIPQHSDARVLDQLIYKWDHSRRVIGKVLIDKYRDLADTGWSVTSEDIARDVKALVADNVTDFLKQ
ncbi:MAG: glucuronate isomerase [Anaerolineae bacterium]|nr:glucuronate isomerase [Phycisphaerae bacterium]